MLIVVLALAAVLCGCECNRQQTVNFDPVIECRPVVNVYVDNQAQASNAYGLQERPNRQPCYRSTRNEDAYCDDLRRAELQGRIRELRRQISEDSCR